jgi:ElaB/YqjD/DUF883 family membrane-anchored ribosome-binding protein
MDLRVAHEGTSMMEHTVESSAALANELRNVVSQAEALLEAISQDRDEALGALRERVHESIDTAKARLEDLEQQAAQATQRVAVAAETWVRDNPWTAVAIAASAGLLIGALLVGSGRRTPNANQGPNAE